LNCNCFSGWLDVPAGVPQVLGWVPGWVLGSSGLVMINDLTTPNPYILFVIYCSLPKYLSEEIECIQKRAMSTIFPDFSYVNAINYAGLSTLFICFFLIRHYNNAALSLKLILTKSTHML
jgi:hypothetical protein